MSGATQTNLMQKAHCENALQGIAPMIGNTPLLRIEYTLEGQSRHIFAKYESENMTGSVKDRMAVHIIEKGSVDGSLQAGDTIVEASSGNTGMLHSVRMTLCCGEHGHEYQGDASTEEAASGRPRA